MRFQIGVSFPESIFIYIINKWIQALIIRAVDTPGKRKVENMVGIEHFDQRQIREKIEIIILIGGV